MPEADPPAGRTPEPPVLCTLGVRLRGCPDVVGGTVVDDDVMWLNLEAGTARSLRRRYNMAFEVPPSLDWRSYGWRALVVEAAHTYLPEAAIDCLPELAAAEVAVGLTGPLRTQIASTDPDDPELAVLRDELIASLGGTPDVSGALRVVDLVYTSRLLRHQVPPVVTASCLAWYGHWRNSNAGPAIDTAQALQQSVTAWTTQPPQRTDIDMQIVAHARHLASDPLVALEELPA